MHVDGLEIKNIEANLYPFCDGCTVADLVLEHDCSKILKFLHSNYKLTCVYAEGCCDTYNRLLEARKENLND